MAGQTVVDIALGVLLAEVIMGVFRSVLQRFARYRASKLRITIGDLR